MTETKQSSPEFIMQISALLEKAGMSAQVLSAKHFTPGRNNRTYRIQTAEGPFVVKQYLRQEGDKRDRLASEFAFLSYAKQVVPFRVPQPFYKDSGRDMALYEFMDGRPLQAEEVKEAEVEEAAHFFCALNEASLRQYAENLPLASEACFSIQEHLELISARVGRLEGMKPETMEDQAAQKLIQRLSQYWQGLRSKIIHSAKGDDFDLTAPLAAAQRCISPSDFGFHNALRMSEGRLCFLDFEYAGWDDPAKMTGDFFSQLALPVPETLFNSFVKQVMRPFLRPDELVRRAQLLRFVYRVKWCCIALNIFLPVHLARYRFANPALNVSHFKRGQVDKVTTLIESLESLDYGLL